MLTPPGRPGVDAPATRARHATRHEVVRAAMGGQARLVVLGDRDGCHGDDLVDLAERGAARLADLEARWSRFRVDSEISRLNAAAGAAHLLSPATYALVERAVAACELTGGRCDATVLPSLLQLGYDRTHEALAPPPPAGWPTVDVAVPTAWRSPGVAAVELIPALGAVRLAAGAALDPGAIGRGFAADLVAAELVAGGATGVLVDLDGDLRVSGRGPADGAWSVSVEDPDRPGVDLARVAVCDAAVATSRARRRSWGRDGRAVHHVIDPRTGRPVEPGLVAATVLAGDAWLAEALSTAALVAGPDAAAFLAARHVAGLLVHLDGRVERVGSVEAYLA
jgi:thiamine biosynthesis lipoprotein